MLGISSAATIKVYTYNCRKKGGSGPSIPIILEKKGGSGPLDPPPPPGSAYDRHDDTLSMYVDSIDFIMCDVFTQYILWNHYMAYFICQAIAIFIIFEAFR